LGAIHSLSHPIGARFHAHHGLTNAVLMPYVLAYNRPVIEEKMAHAARVLGLEPSFDAFQAWILELRTAIGIPHTLADLKVTPDALEELAAEAVADPNTPDNPRPARQADMLRILQAAMAGDLAALIS
jgi:alcohol dehydrogenase class IV